MSVVADQFKLPRTWRWPSMGWRIAGAMVVAALLIVRSAPVTELSSLLTNSSNANASAGPTDAYGFSTSLESLPDAKLGSRLDAMKATGANMVRFDVSWDIVQSGGPDSYNWSTYDRVFAAIQSRNMTPVGVIDFVPSWARGNGCTDSKFCPTADPAAYGQFASAAAARYYSYGAQYWEIWNEPNISYRFHPGANAGVYVPMLKAAYSDIKAIEPNDTVIAGGTAPSATDSGNLTPADWTKALYADGAKGYFDALAAHPYTYPYSPADNLPDDAWGQMSTMHDTMAAHGDGNKRIWVTEFGAPTNGPDQAGDHVSEAQQAQIVTDAIHIFKSYSWSGPFMWYDYQDDGTGTWNSENFYGLVRADGSHKPSYNAWVNTIKAIKQ